MSKRTGAARPTRRQFARTLAALAATPLLAESAAAADPPRTAADALAEVVRLRHGKHLTDEQMKQVLRSIQTDLRLGDILRRTKLTNGDEPAFAFTADVPDA
jgi:hypothetical protein